MTEVFFLYATLIQIDSKIHLWITQELNSSVTSCDKACKERIEFIDSIGLTGMAWN
jgi:hypothetical protein